jgi:hypothetical protein
MIKEEKEGWIFIGEIEFKYNPFSKYKDDEPVFMYVKTSINLDGTKMWYYYGFGRGILNPTYMTFFGLDKRYSLTTILQYFISHEIIFKGVNDTYKLAANLQACRLAGMTEWILPNEDFLNKKIEIEDLEKNWRTDKESKKIEEFQDNKYASDEDKAKVLKEGIYKI